MPLSAEPPRRLDIATDMRADPQPAEVACVEAIHQPPDGLGRLRRVLRDVPGARRRLRGRAARVELAHLDLPAPADLPRLARPEPRQASVAVLGLRRVNRDMPSR